MFARNLRMKLKSHSALEFSRLYEQQILPVLRQQPGFRDGMTFISGERTEAVAISLWDRKESAEDFERSTYAGLMQRLDSVLAEPAEVSGLVVSNSTAHQLVARG